MCVDADATVEEEEVQVSRAIMEDAELQEEMQEEEDMAEEMDREVNEAASEASASPSSSEEAEECAVTGESVKDESREEPEEPTEEKAGMKKLRRKQQDGTEADNMVHIPAPLMREVLPGAERTSAGHTVKAETATAPQEDKTPSGKAAQNEAAASVADGRKKAGQQQRMPAKTHTTTGVAPIGEAVKRKRDSEDRPVQARLDQQRSPTKNSPTSTREVPPPQPPAPSPLPVSGAVWVSWVVSRLQANTLGILALRRTPAYLLRL